MIYVDLICFVRGISQIDDGLFSTVNLILWNFVFVVEAPRYEIFLQLLILGLIHVLN